MVLSNPYKGHRQPGSVGLPLPHVDVRLTADGKGEQIAPETLRRLM